jgi:hypothetical protein
VLTFVVNALALVRLWWTLHTNLSCNLADLLLRNTLNGKVSVIRYLKANALRCNIENWVRITKGKVKILALKCYTVTNAGELELLLEALRDTNNHVVDKGTDKTLLSIGLSGLINASNENLLALLSDSNQLRESTSQLALRTLNGNGGVINCHSDSSRNLDRLLTNTRHGCLLSFLSDLPNVSDDLAANAVLTSVAVAHHALRSGNHCSTKTTKNAWKLLSGGVNAQTRLGNTTNAADNLSALLTILKGDVKSLLRLSILNGVTLDIALFGDDASNLNEHLARWHGYGILAS